MTPEKRKPDKRKEFENRWRFSVDINAIIYRFQTDSDDAATASACAAAVADALAEPTWAAEFPTLRMLSDHLRSARSVDEFDAMMDQIYSYCDQSGIWLGWDAGLLGPK